MTHRLISSPASVKELAQPFRIALPSFLKHTRVLEESGLIGTRKEGRVRTCILDAARMVATEPWLVGLLALWEARTDRLAHCVKDVIDSKER